MELYTLSREFEKLGIIEDYSSLIWTERYYGDSDVEIIFPVSLAVEITQKLPLNSFLSLDESLEPMIVETFIREGNQIKAQGISVLSWLNNRFIRTSEKHQAQTWYLEDLKAGEILWTMIHGMCFSDSPYLDGTIDIGLPVEILSKLKIPELGLHSYDTTGPKLSAAIPFGRLYDEMRKIAESEKLGMQILLEKYLNPDAEQPLGYRNYRGVDHTRAQDPDVPQNEIVQFSASLNSLGNVKELLSQTRYKNLAFAFAPNLRGVEPANFITPTEGSVFGLAIEEGSEGFSGFDLRAEQIFVDDVVDDTRTGSPTTDLNEGTFDLLYNILNDRAKTELSNNPIINVVDGDIVETGQFEYGRDYGLGDLVEIQGSDGSISSVMVTEHIRANTSSGERSVVVSSREDAIQ